MNTGIDGGAVPASGHFLSPHLLPLKLKVLFLLAVGGFAAVALLAGQYLVAGGLCIGAVAAAILVKYPRAWVYTSVVLWSVWFRSSSQQVSGLEVGMVAFYLGGLMLWFAGMLIARKKLVHNLADQLILVFFSLGIVNLIIGILYGVDPMMWGREFLLFAFILYYFPIRELIDTRRRLITFLWLAAVIIFGLGIANLQMYLRAAGNAVYAFNLLSSRVSLNETIFLGAALFSTVFLLYSRRWRLKLVFLLLTIFYSAVLIASFTRGAWLMFIIGQVLIFFLVDGRKRLSLGLYLGIGTISFIVGVAFFFSNLSDFIFRSIESRLSSSTKGTQDISVKARVVESEAIIKGIYERPLSGAGMGSRVVFYDVIDRYTTSPTFMHNGYLFIAYKAGIPMALFFFIGILLYQGKGFLLVYRMRDPLYRCAAIGASTALLAALIISLTSNQFALRHGLSLIAVYIALIAIIERVWHAEQIALAGANNSLPPGAPALPQAEK